MEKEKETETEKKKKKQGEKEVFQFYIYKLPIDRPAAVTGNGKHSLIMAATLHLATHPEDAQACQSSAIVIFIDTCAGGVSIPSWNLGLAMVCFEGLNTDTP